MAGGIGENAGKVMVVIPAFNEEEQIPSVLAQVKTELPAAEVLVVNDGSTDRTAQKARAGGAKVISLPFNMGYGVALQTGYKYALRYGFDYVLQMDGDGQHDPRYLQVLLAQVEGGQTDIAIGSRFLGEGEYRPSGFRRLGMRLFGAIATVLIGQKISDPTSGFQALNRKVLAFYSRDAFPGDYPDADVLVMLHRAGLRIREISVRMLPNANGRSMHSGWKPLYYIYKMLLSITLNLLRKE